MRVLPAAEVSQAEADSPAAEAATRVEAEADSDLLPSDILEVLKSFNALCFDVSVLYEDHCYEAHK